MSRERKFKAIDKRSKKVLFEGTLSDIRNAAGRLNFTTWEWLEYTGLKDKNGKEIYEGDILKHHNGRLSDPIKFPEDYIWLKVRTEDDDYKKSIEIIGNIYENAASLEKIEAE